MLHIQNSVDCSLSYLITTVFNSSSQTQCLPLKLSFIGSKRCYSEGSKFGEYGGCGEVIYPKETILSLVLMFVYCQELSCRRRTLSIGTLPISAFVLSYYQD